MVSMAEMTAGTATVMLFILLSLLHIRLILVSATFGKLLCLRSGLGLLLFCPFLTHLIGGVRVSKQTTVDEGQLGMDLRIAKHASQHLTLLLDVFVVSTGEADVHFTETQLDTSEGCHAPESDTQELVLALLEQKLLLNPTPYA